MTCWMISNEVLPTTGWHHPPIFSTFSGSFPRYSNVFERVKYFYPPNCLKQLGAEWGYEPKRRLRLTSGSSFPE